MDFVTKLLISTNLKENGYDSILVIIDWPTKMVYYKPVKINFDALRLARVIMDVVVWQHGLPDLIVTNRGYLFTSKFWSLLCYFFGIKRRLSTAFYPQTDGQTERENSTMEGYLQAFVNFEQNNWARLLAMAKFVYNNAKKVSIGHTSFELNCGYHPRVLFKEDINSFSQWKTTKKLSSKLQELMTVCLKNFYHTQKLQK